MSAIEELILYATPTGAFAEACDAYWELVAANQRATTAQRYPPHCTLTGFFHRVAGRVPEVLDDVDHVLDGVEEPLVVERSGLEEHADWLGFVLVSPALDETTRRFVDRHRVRAGEDALRPKSWLHLSLAYGNGADLSWHRSLASQIFADVAPSAWSVGLWCRRGEAWSRLDAERRR